MRKVRVAHERGCFINVVGANVVPQELAHVGAKGAVLQMISKALLGL